MKPVEAHHRRSVRALIWLLGLAAGGILALAAAAFIIGATDDATHRSIESYHLRTLNITRKVAEEIDHLNVALRRNEAARWMGIVGTISNRVEDIALLQQQSGDWLQAGAVTRVQLRLERLKAADFDNQQSDTPALVDSFRLAVMQLEKLHLVRSDQLIQVSVSSHQRQASLLGFVVIAILGVSAALFAFVYRSLSASLKKQLETEAALEVTRQRLRDGEKLQALGQLVGGIAHDFNNLLMVITGQLELISHAQRLPARTRSGIQEALNAASRAAGLTRQLLAFARRQPVERRREDLNAVVTSTESMLRTLIRDDVEISIILDPSPMIVEVDAGQVQQLLTNLILNARDAVARGGKISVATAAVTHYQDDDLAGVKPGRYCRLTITDDGIGMDKQTLSRAFEPFFTTKDVGEGTGLGLSTVHGIVGAHDGSVMVDSKVDRGTRIDIYLPRCDEAGLPSQLATQEPARGGTETLLLIEDEKPIRELTGSTLRRFGYTVLVAKDGRDAVRISKEIPGRVDLIVSDVIMPGMTGPEAVAQILNVQPNAMVVYMSGYTDDVVLATGISASSVLRKPFELDDLARLVRRSLDARHSAVA